MINWKYELQKKRQRLIMAIVWRLPAEVVMWATVRAIANATTGKFQTTNPSELKAMDALARWGDSRGGDRVYGEKRK